MIFCLERLHRHPAEVALPGHLLRQAMLAWEIAQGQRLEAR